MTVSLTDHVFTVPLDHTDPSQGLIEVFAREAVDPRRADDDLPWLVFLQGGPGGKSPRPLAADGWLGHALRTHRVLLLDQRGTGRSTPVTAKSLPAPDGPELAAYLRHFRADSIVADAEHIRRALGVERWSTLGQSYGGFVTLTYLSQAPDSLSACYVTGGLPGLHADADEVYGRTYRRVADKLQRYFTRHPDDRARLDGLLAFLERNDIRLPDGDRLTPRRLKFLGMELGTGSGAESLHWLLTEAWVGGELSDEFLYQVMAETSFAGNPLYAVMHESIYGQGAPTNWSAHRLAPDLPLTGEMIYPWMFDEIRALRPFRETAEHLAQMTWPALYDPARLAVNEVPVGAVVYYDDMYVDEGLSARTAREVGNVTTWVTNEWEHDGLRVSGETVIRKVLGLIQAR
ncbi:alpha/beta hydrolase [Herbidospora galbida]|uniref:Alpha/beta hydrolase n=1 Tax=Herbidospora galbida TaxID=2575442 RepID=A0A4U3M8Q4_9ACTN|nr:alpha/beta fold hydrolase [Herbidospora galbida]TKK84950.1 alpha/beta hydrolase [Herbidospora galbida]